MTAGGPEKQGGGRRGFAFGPDLLPRLVSAMVLIPLTAAALILGHIWFALLIALVMVIAYREWEIMITGSVRTWPAVFLMGFLAVGAVAYPMNGAWASAAVLLVPVLVAAAVKAPRRRWRIGGLVYFSLVLVAFLSIRGSSAAGIWAGIFLLAITWLTDSGAYFVGRIVGGVKLSPDVSPSKTWSGALGGLAFGTAGGVLVWLVAGWGMGEPSPFVIGLLISVVVSIAAQAGDLSESAVKRRFMVKDSGAIIPGHGGLVDRIDSLTMAAIVLWIIGLAHRGFGAVPQGILIW